MKGHFKPHTDETKRLISAKKTANPTRYWSGKSFSAEHRNNLSRARTGISPWNKDSKGMTPPAWNKGKRHLAREKHWNWRGGISGANSLERNSFEYKEWRKKVFQRDDYTCQACGQRGGEIHADHDLPFALFPSLRLEVLNGQTLCASCHRKKPTTGDIRSLERLHLITAD